MSKKFDAIVHFNRAAITLIWDNNETLFSSIICFKWLERRLRMPAMSKALATYGQQNLIEYMLDRIRNANSWHRRTFTFCNTILWFPSRWIWNGSWDWRFVFLRIWNHFALWGSLISAQVIWFHNADWVIFFFFLIFSTLVEETFLRTFRD